MKLLSVKQAKITGYLALTILSDEGERERFLVSDRAYSEADFPEASETLSEQTYTFLKSEHEIREVLVVALRYLSFSDHSERELIRKLMAKGFSRELSEGACEEAVRLGYINERRQLERHLPSVANTKLWGARRIIPYFVNKGYHTDDIRSVLRSLCDREEINFKENFKRLLEKTKTDERNYEKRRKLAFRYGYQFN